jgi:bile acid:Na+ symporter, BASS family
VRYAIGIGLPLLITFAMTVVGLELTLQDLRRVLHYPVHVAVALIGQVVVLPLVAAVLILVLHPEPAVAGGLILAASAPQAMSSNFYCLLARADIALSVTLTAVSSAMAVVSTPLVAGLAFTLLLEPQAGFVLPIGKVMQQVVTGLLLPVSAGMLVRHYAAGFVERNRARFQRVSLAAILLMLAILAVDQAENIWRSLGSIVLVAVAFTLAASALGLGLAKTLSWNREDTVTLVAAFPSRSLSIATLIAVNVLGRVEFLSFAVIFFVAQALLLVPAMILSRNAGPHL